jgi:putative resolvase
VLSDLADSVLVVDIVIGDVTEVVTGACARRCGQRATKDQAARVIAVATGEAAE